MPPRYAQKKDSTHRPICDELRKHGIEVVETLYPVDAHISRGDFFGWLEIKPEGRGTYTLMQLKFISSVRAPVQIVKTTAEALYFLKSRQGLSQAQQDRLAAFCVTAKKEKYNSEIIDRVLKG